MKPFPPSSFAVAPWRAAAVAAGLAVAAIAAASARAVAQAPRVPWVLTPRALH